MFVDIEYNTCPSGLFQRAIAIIMQFMQKRAAILGFVVIFFLAALLLILFTNEAERSLPELDAQKGQDVLGESAELADQGLEYREDRMEPRRIVPVIRDGQEVAPEREPSTESNRYEVPETESSWDDSVTQDGLGEKRWMARPSDEEIAQIESVLNQERVDPEARALRNRDRRSAIETVRAVVDECVGLVREEHPDAIGRVSVVFDFDTTGAFGMIKNGRVGLVWKLDEYPGFVTCVERGVADLRFESGTNDTVMEVEYPFFYEGD